MDFERKVHWNFEPLTSKDDQKTNEGKRSALSADSVCAFRESFVVCCFCLILFVFGCLMFSVRCVSVYTYIYIYMYTYIYVSICGCICIGLALVVTSDVALRT